MGIGKRFRNGLRTGGRNWILLLVSVILAASIWILSNLSHTYSGTISVPVVAESNIDGHSPVSSNSVVVSARCRVEGFRLLKEGSRRKRQPVRVSIDRADLRRAGADTYFISGSTKNNYVSQIFGDGAVLEAFITDTLRFVFPVENHKKVPVVVPQSLSFRSQYMREGPLRVSPDSITIYGEKSRLDAIEKVTTSRLSLSDLHETTQGMLRVGKVKGVRLSDEQVSYSLPVVRYVELSSTVPMEVWNAPAGRHLQVFPSVATVTLRCVFPLQKDPFSTMRFFVDYRDFSASLNGRCVGRTMRLPAGVLEYRIEPEVFECVESD